MNESQISLLIAFLAAKVEFVVVGGMAVNAHGHSRSTHDLDLFIRPTEENARKAYGALAAAGAPIESMEPNDLLDDEANFRFGRDEDHVDVLASIGDMPFDQVWRNRVEASVAELKIPFISKSDLIANKRQVGRHQDLADAEKLSRLTDVEFR